MTVLTVITNKTLKQTPIYVSLIHKQGQRKPGAGGICRRWLQDPSKRKLADFLIFFASPPSCFPGSPEVHPTIDQNKRPG